MNLLQLLFKKQPKSKYQTQLQLTREEKRDLIDKGTLNFLSPHQVEEVINDNTDIDFIEKEFKEKMNEIDEPYIIDRVLPPKVLPGIRKVIDPKEILIGSIVGDIIGSKYEFTEHNYIKAQYEEIPHKKSIFTDDTVLSIATMNAILENSQRPDFRKHYIEAYKKYPRAGYGSSFIDWALGEIDNTQGYHSMANGSAMRLSFIPAYYDSLRDVIEQTIKSTCVTHNHVEAVKHSLIISICIWMALHGCSKLMISKYCERYFIYTEEERRNLFHKDSQYDWNPALNALPNNPSRQSLFANYAVPFAIKCFLETESYEECMREILSHYGDSDTICAIAGGLCVAYYGTTGLDNEKILREAQVPEI